jgi:hypothetical protein
MVVEKNDTEKTKIKINENTAIESEGIEGLLVYKYTYTL